MTMPVQKFDEFGNAYYDWVAQPSIMPDWFQRGWAGLEGLVRTAENIFSNWKNKPTETPYAQSGWTDIERLARAAWPDTSSWLTDPFQAARERLETAFLGYEPEGYYEKKDGQWVERNIREERQKEQESAWLSGGTPPEIKIATPGSEAIGISPLKTLVNMALDPIRAEMAPIRGLVTGRPENITTFIPFWGTIKNTGSEALRNEMEKVERAWEKSEPAQVISDVSRASLGLHQLGEAVLAVGQIAPAVYPYLLKAMPFIGPWLAGYALRGVLSEGTNAVADAIRKMQSFTNAVNEVKDVVKEQPSEQPKVPEVPKAPPEQPSATPPLPRPGVSPSSFIPVIPAAIKLIAPDKEEAGKQISFGGGAGSVPPRKRKKKKSRRTAGSKRSTDGKRATSSPRAVSRDKSVSLKGSVNQSTGG